MKTPINLFFQTRILAIAHILINHPCIYLQPEDMPDAEDFDENDNWEEGLTELDRQRHSTNGEYADLIEDEDDSFVDERDEEE